MFEDEDSGDLFVAVVVVCCCEIGFFVVVVVVVGVGATVDFLDAAPVFGAFQEKNFAEFEKFLTVEIGIPEMEGNLERQIIFCFSRILYFLIEEKL